MAQNPLVNMMANSVSNVAATPNAGFMNALPQMINSIRAMGNPSMLVNNILNSNPQFAQMIRGQNPQQLAMNLMQSRGIDPQQVMEMFR